MFPSQSSAKDKSRTSSRIEQSKNYERIKSSKVKNDYGQKNNQRSQSFSKDPRKSSLLTATSIPIESKINRLEECICGPNFFGNVLGPTADEPILLGLKAFADICDQSSPDTNIDPINSEASVPKFIERPKDCIHGPNLFGNVLGSTVDEPILLGLQTFLDMCNECPPNEEDLMLVNNDELNEEEREVYESDADQISVTESEAAGIQPSQELLEMLSTKSRSSQRAHNGSLDGMETEEEFDAMRKSLGILEEEHSLPLELESETESKLKNKISLKSESNYESELDFKPERMLEPQVETDTATIKSKSQTTEQLLESTQFQTQPSTKEEESALKVPVSYIEKTLQSENGAEREEEKTDENQEETEKGKEEENENEKEEENEKEKKKENEEKMNIDNEEQEEGKEEEKEGEKQEQNEKEKEEQVEKEKKEQIEKEKEEQMEIEKKEQMEKENEEQMEKEKKEQMEKIKEEQKKEKMFNSELAIVEEEKEKTLNSESAIVDKEKENEEKSDSAIVDKEKENKEKSESAIVDKEKEDKEKSESEQMQKEKHELEKWKKGEPEIPDSKETKLKREPKTQYLSCKCDSYLRKSICICSEESSCSCEACAGSITSLNKCCICNSLDEKFGQTNSLPSSCICEAPSSTCVCANNEHRKRRSSASHKIDNMNENSTSVANTNNKRRYSTRSKQNEAPASTCVCVSHARRNPRCSAASNKNRVNTKASPSNSLANLSNKQRYSSTSKQNEAPSSTCICVGHARSKRRSSATYKRNGVNDNEKRMLLSNNVPRPSSSTSLTNLNNKRRSSAASKGNSVHNNENSTLLSTHVSEVPSSTFIDNSSNKRRNSTTSKQNSVNNDEDGVLLYSRSDSIPSSLLSASANTNNKRRTSTGSKRDSTRSSRDTKAVSRDSARSYTGNANEGKELAETQSKDVSDKLVKESCLCSTCGRGGSTSSTESAGNHAKGDCQVQEVRYAITKIIRFADYTTFEVMKSTRKKPKVMPKSLEGVFVLRNRRQKL